MTYFQIHEFFAIPFNQEILSFTSLINSLYHSGVSNCSSFRILFLIISHLYCSRLPTVLLFICLDTVAFQIISISSFLFFSSSWTLSLDAQFDSFVAA